MQQTAASSLDVRGVKADTSLSGAGRPRSEGRRRPAAGAGLQGGPELEGAVAAAGGEADGARVEAGRDGAVLVPAAAGEGLAGMAQETEPYLNVLNRPQICDIPIGDNPS